MDFVQHSIAGWLVGRRMTRSEESLTGEVRLFLIHIGDWGNLPEEITDLLFRQIPVDTSYYVHTNFNTQ